MVEQDLVWVTAELGFHAEHVSVRAGEVRALGDGGGVAADWVGVPPTAHIRQLLHIGAVLADRQARRIEPVRRAQAPQQASAGAHRSPITVRGDAGARLAQICISASCMHSRSPALGATDR